MRLIDADELKKNLLEYNYTTEHNQIFRYIDEQPAAYDVDKVVEHLKTARDGYSTAQLMTTTDAELVKRFIAKEKAMNLAIEIVKAGGIDVD